MSTDTIPALITDVAAIDWNDLAAVAATNDKLLTALDSDRTTLRELAERALDNPELLRLCEYYDILDKIVLHDDPSGWRLRLHVFLPGYFDRPTTTAGPTAAASCTAVTPTPSTAPTTNSAPTPSTSPPSGPGWCAPNQPATPTPCTTP